jgi:ELWxxDGT repeat protein/autotransporter-associated beta strand protein
MNLTWLKDIARQLGFSQTRKKRRSRTRSTRPRLEQLERRVLLSATLLQDINPYSNSSNPQVLGVLGNKIIFTANDGTHGVEPWVSDGTPAGTFLLQDIAPGQTSSNPTYFATAGNKLIFIANDTQHGEELFVTDGTSAGTFLLQDISHGYSGSNPVYLGNAGNKVIFSANDQTDGIEPWVTDGTSAGTFLLANINPNSNSSNPTYLTTAGGKVYFNAVAYNDDIEPYVTDGTVAGTSLLKDINPYGYAGASPAYIGTAGSKVIFNATLSGATDPWVTDGTYAGTVMLQPITSAKYVATLGSKVIFSANDSVNGTEPWVTDGTSAGTVMLQNIGYSSNPVYLGSTGSKIIFSASDNNHGTEPWVTDGTSAGTFLLQDIAQYSSSSSPVYLGNAGSKVIFTANDVYHGIEPWVTDGTSAGTFLLQDIYPSSSSSNPSYLGNAGSKVIFTASDGTHGLEPWVTDGTIGGTFLLQDIYPSSPSSNPLFLGTAGNKVVFTANDGTHGIEPWVSDGTSAGTFLLQDIYPSSSTSNPTYFAAVGGKVFFTANDGTHGTELWTTDGTVAETFMVQDIYPGSSSSNPVLLTAAGSNLFFSANDGTHGVEPWVTSTNFPPIANAGGPYTVSEGGSITLDASGSTDSQQPNTTLTYAWDLNGNGIYGETGAAATHGAEVGMNPTFFSAPDLDGPRTYTVSLLVTDSAGLTSTATATINILNAPPTATFSNNSPVYARNPFTVSFTNATDPSAADQAAGFTYSYDFDNNGDFTGPGEAANIASPTRSFTFNTAGVYTVHGRITDKDGGFTDYYTSVTVLDATWTWTGLGGNANWSTPANWNKVLAPVANADLVFPAGAAQLTNTNNLANDSVFNSLTISGGSYQLIGNRVALNGNLTVSATSGLEQLELTVEGSSYTSKTISVVNQGVELIIDNTLSVIQTLTISGAGTILCDAGAMGIGSTIVSSGVVVISDGRDLGSTATVAAGAQVQIQSLFSTTQSLYTLNGSGPDGSGALVFNPNGANSTVTWTSAITLGSGGATIGVGGGAGSSLLISGAISGSGSLTKVGSQALNLSGLDTYTGATLVNVGTLEMSGTGTIYYGVTAATTTVSAGAALQMNGSLAVGNGPLVLHGTGVSNTGALYDTGAYGYWYGSVTLSSDSGAQIGAIGLGSRLFIGGVVSGPVGLSKTGNGTVVLSMADSYTGSTYVNGGTLELQNALSLNGTTVYAYAGSTIMLDGGITVAGTTLNLSGTLANGTGSNTWSGSVGLSGGTLDGGGSTSQTLTVSGPISGYNGLIVTDFGTVQLSGTQANTYSGTTSVGTGNNATLVLNKTAGTTAIPGALTVNAYGTVRLLASNLISSSSAVSVLGYGTLDLNNQSDTIGALNIAGGTITTGSGLLTLSGDVTSTTNSYPFPTGVINGNLSLGGATRNFNTQFLTINAIVSNGALTSTGGSMTLMGANTYTGLTTVSGGFLTIDGNQGGSAVQISQGTLAGRGTVGAITTTGGTISPGDGATGILTASSADLSGGGNLTLLVPGYGTAGTNFSQLKLTGGLTLGGTSSVTFNLSGLTTLSSDTIVLDSTTTGTFSKLSAINNSVQARPTLAYSTGQVSVTFAHDAGPTAVNDSATTVENRSVNIAVLANDTDPYGDPLSVYSAAAPAHGAAQINADGSITYTPALNFIGNDSFTYTISDPFGVHSTATVSITVTADTTPPVVVSTTVDASGTLGVGATSVQVNFSEVVSGANVGSSYQLQSVGPDGLLGTADDILVPVSASYAGTTATLSFASLPASVYRLTVKDTITDLAGNKLDGDGNGTAGGNYVRDFVVIAISPTVLTSPNSFAFDPLAGGYGAGQLVQGTNNAFDGANRTQVGGAGFSPGFASAADVVTVAPANTFNNPLTTSVNTPLTVSATVVVDANKTGVYDLHFIATATAGSHAFIHYIVDGVPSDGVNTPYGSTNLLEYVGNGTAGGWHELVLERQINLTPGTHTVGVVVTTDGGTMSVANPYLEIVGYNKVGGVPAADVVTVAPANTLNNPLTTSVNAPLTVSATVVVDANKTGVYDLHFIATATFGSHAFIHYIVDGVPSDGVNTPYGSTNLLEYVGNGTAGGWHELVLERQINLTPGTHTVGVVVTTDGGTMSVANPYLEIVGYNKVGGVPAADVVTVAPANTLNNPLTTSVNAPLTVSATVVVDANKTGVYDLHFIATATAGSHAFIHTIVDGVPSDGANTPYGSTNLLQYVADGTAGGWHELMLDRQITLTPGAHTVGVVVTTDGGTMSVANPYLEIVGYNNLATVANSGQTLVTPTQALSGLNVSRQVTVPSTGSQDFARTVDYFQNPTASPITTTVTIVGNLGSDAATRVFATSTGDTTPSVNDQWFGTDGGPGTTAVISIIHGPLGLKPTGVSVSGDNIEWTYSLTVPANQTLELATFTVQASTEAGAIAEANALVTPSSFGGQAAEFLGASDLNALINFVFQASTTVEAAAQGVVFSAASQRVTLSATVSSSSNGILNTVTQGTVTFSVFNGATQIGSSVTSGTVANGTASAIFTLPAGTPVGAYSVHVSYSGGVNFGGSSNSGDSTFPALTVYQTGGLIDNGQPGYAETGSGWTSFNDPSAYGGTERYAAPGSGANTASWQVPYLTPGAYDVEVSWTAYANRASDAAYQVFDGATLLGTVLINQQQAASGGVTSGGVNFQSLGRFSIQSGTLTVVLSDNANGYVIADAMLAQTAALPALVDNSQYGYSETGSGWASFASSSAYFGNERYAAPGAGANTATWQVPGLANAVYDVQVSWTAYTNRATNATYQIFDGSTLLGTAQVNQQLTPSGGTTAGGIAFQSLGRFPISSGTLKVVLSDNANGYVVADAVFAQVATLPALVDNSQYGYSEIGSGWASFSDGTAYLGNERYIAPGTGANTATWQTTGLPSGLYDVEMTWVAYSNRATNATYSVYDGSTLLGTLQINQQLAPMGGSTVGGVPFQSLGRFPIGSGTLKVVLSDNANGYVIADAMLAQTTTLPALVDNSQYGYSETGTGWNSFTDPTAYFSNERYAAPGTGANTAAWQSTGLAPGSYNVEIDWTAYSNRASNATYQVFDGSTLLATLQVNQQSAPAGGAVVGGVQFQSLGRFPIGSGTVKVVLSDNANGYVIADALLVQPAALPVTVDNSQFGYSETGAGWTSFSDPNAYAGNERYAAPGNGANTASWQVLNLPVGAYDVQVDWTAFANRATNATYQVYDGATLLGSVQINQQTAPTGGSTVNGVTFQSLGHFTISSGSLIVVLTDNANGYVIADAMLVM